MEKHQEVFDWVKRTFFPRWDRNGDWSYRVVDDLNGASGYCRPREKTIEICECREVRRLLIHEIAHAVTTGFHGKAWLKRYRRAAEKARSIGEEDLAKRIEEEADGYATAFVETAASLYDKMYEWIRNHDRDKEPPSFDAICYAVGREFGLSPHEFLESYRRAHKVYDKALKDRELSKRNRLLLQNLQKTAPS